MYEIHFREHDVVRTISQNEQMPAADIEIYLSAGRSAIDCISLALHAAKKDVQSITNILDLPCGHGRVLRYLTAGFPHAEITACDIMHDGVDFCATTFGANPVYSSDNPCEISLEYAAFDLIWVGSLFTHLDADLWSAFLYLFRSLLRPDGLLVFTTHGYDAYRRMVYDTFDYGISVHQRLDIISSYEQHGFGYVKYPTSDSYYGLSLSDPAWALRRIAELGGLRIVCFAEKCWVNFHDMFVCSRDLNGQPASVIGRRCTRAS
jgi:SAM-dependent methyltransferase